MMDIGTALQSGDLGYIILAGAGTAIFFLWKQNQWLTMQLLKLTSDTTQVLTSLLAELKIGPVQRTQIEKNLGPTNDPTGTSGQ